MSTKNDTETGMNFKSLMRFSFKYWRQRPWLLLSAASLTILAVVADIIYPIYSGRLVDALALGFETPADYIKPATYAFLGMAAMGLMQRLAKSGGFYVWVYFTSKLLPEVVKDAHYKVQRFSTNWHANSFAGTTVRKITRGMWGFDQFGDVLYLSLIPTALVLLGITISQIIHEPVIGFSFLAGLTIYIATAIFLALRYVSPANREWVEQDSKLSGTIADSITCNSVVKTFGSESREDARLGGNLETWRGKVKHAWLRWSNADLLQTIILYLMLQTLIGLAVWKWYIGEFSPGDVSYTMTSAFIVMGYVRDIGSHVRQIQRALNDVEDIVAFNDATPAIADKTGSKPLDVKEGRVEYRDVTFRYDNRSQPTYDGFNLVVKPGEKVGLVGESGSGKSTFVKLLQRLYDLEDGQILIDGQDIAGVTLESLRQSISMVPQEPLLFHRSLRENIAYGRPDVTIEEIAAAAVKAHAHEFIMRLPEGYETMVGERGIKLSGGERQRVAIARAILADKPLLILDEATSSLDSLSENLIQEAIENLTQDRTTIMIAHRLSTIKSVDRILVFDKGRIVEEGTHDDLVAKPNGVYRALFEMQSFGMVI